MSVVHTQMISGPLTISKEEFEKYYVPRIESAIFNKHKFIVGDAEGVDQYAQIYLKDRLCDVTVYHMFDIPRRNLDYPCIGGFTSDLERDRAMTNASTHDILWYRSQEEQKKLYGNKYRYRISGTEKNELRRKEKRNI